MGAVAKDVLHHEYYYNQKQLTSDSEEKLSTENTSMVTIMCFEQHTHRSEQQNPHKTFDGEHHFLNSVCVGVESKSLFSSRSVFDLLLY